MMAVRYGAEVRVIEIDDRAARQCGVLDGILAEVRCSFVAGSKATTAGKTWAIHARPLAGSPARISNSACPSAAGNRRRNQRLDQLVDRALDITRPLANGNPAAVVGSREDGEVAGRRPSAADLADNEEVAAIVGGGGRWQAEARAAVTADEGIALVSTDRIATRTPGTPCWRRSP